MVGFPDSVANFGNSVREAALSVLRPSGKQKRKFDDSAEERSEVAAASSPLKRQATSRDQQSEQPPSQQPLQNGVSHQHRQEPRANGPPIGRLPFSPGFLTEQRRGSGHFTPRQQPRPAAQHQANGQTRNLLPSPASRQLPAPRWRRPSTLLSPPNDGLAALRFSTPLPQQTSIAAVVTGLGRTARNNGFVPAEQAADIRRSTLTRGRRVLGPGAAIRSFSPQQRLAITPGSMARSAEQWQPSDTQLTAQDLQNPEVKQLAAQATRASSQAETQRLWQQAVSVARQQRTGAHHSLQPVPTPNASRMVRTPQPPAAQAGAAAGADDQASPAPTVAAEASPAHLPPAQQAQRPPAAGASSSGALAGFDKFLASLSQQTAAQHLQPHLQPAFREAYRSLDEQRRKAEKERADAELAASHRRFEDLTRGPRAQSLLARAAAALSLSADKPAAPSRPTAAAASAAAPDAQPTAAQLRSKRQPKPSRAKPAAEEAGSGVIDLLSSDDDGAAPADEGSGRQLDGNLSADEEGISSALQEAALSDEDEEQQEDEEGAWVRPLTEEQRERYAEALAPGPPKELLAKHQRAGIDIRRTEIRCMGGRGWLNDEVINIYMALLQDRDTARRLQGRGPKCHFFNSFFVNKLVRDKHEYNYNEVRRWTTEKRLQRMGQASPSVLDCDRVIVPVHLGAHWTCAVVDLACKAISYYDSMTGKEPEVVEALARWVADEHQNKRGAAVDTAGWPRRYERDIPQQLNSWDCGVFTLQFADAAGRGVELTPPPFRQADMPNLRIKVTADIMAGRIA